MADDRLTLSELFAQYIQSAVANPKTTIQGFLSAVIAISGAMAFFNGIPPKYAGIAMSVAGAAKFLMGTTQQDARNTTPALTPSGKVEEVAAHQLPDDPKNIPIVPVSAARQGE